mmetsp:Transcript_91937/g.297398  ORF Transcript_91937/g.297398 Transcript_91937/m.297398 type:complete len:389 (-) Transcript_91937:90-1256(-)
MVLLRDLVHAERKVRRGESHQSLQQNVLQHLLLSFLGVEEEELQDGKVGIQEISAVLHLLVKEGLKNLQAGNLIAVVAVQQILDVSRGARHGVKYPSAKTELSRLGVWLKLSAQTSHCRGPVLWRLSVPDWITCDCVCRSSAMLAGTASASSSSCPPDGAQAAGASAGASSGSGVARRRNLPGTPAAQMWNWPVRPLVASEGPLRVAEYIQDLLRQSTSDLERIYELPEGCCVDPLLWQYEHLRQFLIELNLLMVALGEECTPDTCPKMTASNEWQYLCAAHRKTQDCAAIDYMSHTIDGSTALLTNAKHFGSRGSVPPDSGKYFQSMARRLYRIFAHVYYHHRSIFDEREAETHLCARFSHFVMRYQLMSPSMLLVPQDAYETNRST